MATARTANTPRMEAPRLRQLTLTERLDGLARRADAGDPVRPARAIFFCVLALMALGFMVQVSHASAELNSYTS